MISYQEFKPHPELKDYIKSYWRFSIKTSTNQPFDILPDGYFDLLIVIKDNCISKVSLTGIWSKAVLVEYHENIEVFGIRFKPLALDSLLQFRINDLLNTSTSINLKDLGLNEQMIIDGLNHPPQLLLNYLNHHFISVLSFRQTDIRMKRLFEIVNLSTGNETVGVISEKIGLSTRQIQRNMNSLVGIGLKEYSRIVRLRKTLRQVKYDKNDYYPYFDQSHFIREVKEHTGFTPQKMDLNKNVRFIQYYNFKD